MNHLRRLPKFEYVGPRSRTEVCALIAGTAPDEVMLLAGGTDAILQMRRRERTPRRVIGLKGATDLDFVREESDGSLTIGAMTTLQKLLSNPLVSRGYPLLHETAAQIGGRELRNVATIGGNIAGALPCADLPPALMTLEARVKLSSRRGERWVPIEQLFPEFGRTIAESDELLSEISVPRLPSRCAGTYLKFHDRHSMDMTVVGVGAFVVLDDDARTLRDVRLAYANGAPTIFRARQTEGILRGHPLTDDALEAAAESACAESSPRTSWRANGQYRIELIRALTKRALARACEKAALQERAQ